MVVGGGEQRERGAVFSCFLILIRGGRLAGGHSQPQCLSHRVVSLSWKLDFGLSFSLLQVADLCEGIVPSLVESHTLDKKLQLIL